MHAGVERHPWGFAIPAAMEGRRECVAAAMLECHGMKKASSALTSGGGLRDVCGGKATIDKPPSEAMVSLRNAVVQVLRERGLDEVADVLDASGNVTKNLYFSTSTLHFHCDPLYYKPCVVSVGVSGERVMTFLKKGRGDRRQPGKRGLEAAEAAGELCRLPVRALDVYVIWEDGYRSWRHGMVDPPSTDISASVSFRSHRPQKRKR